MKASSEFARRVDSPGTTGEPLLHVSGLNIGLETPRGWAQIVSGLDLTLGSGESLAIVGESGSGKSVTMLALLGLLPAGWSVEGSIRYRGRELLGQAERVFHEVRGREIGIVFQDPLSSLNPVRTIGTQITELLRLHLRLGRAEARARALELLRLVEISAPERRIDQYPHELSGGMRQRVLIAMAVACHPRLLIADEPTTALDVTVQAQIVDLVRRLQRELGMAVIWITHDLGVVAQVAQRVAVMYGGHALERGPAVDLFAAPLHPYTRGLLDCIPVLKVTRRQELKAIPGQPPRPTELPPGCIFAPRCRYRQDDVCAVARPALRRLNAARDVACHFDLDLSGAG